MVSHVHVSTSIGGARVVSHVHVITSIGGARVVSHVHVITSIGGGGGARVSFTYYNQHRGCEGSV